MRSRVALVTGGTSGMGAATAEALASMGWSVVIVGRDRARCEARIAHIKRSTSSDIVEYALADLSSQRQVRALADHVAGRHRALHLLVNNAGALYLERGVSEDGIERTLALNHLGPFLLTNLLMPVILESSPARIVNVASIGHRLAPPIRRDDLEWRQRFYRGFQVYHQSKLANLLFTYELARRLEGTGVTANAVGPGLVATRIGHDNRWYWRVLIRTVETLLRQRFKSPEEGARTIVHLATSPEVEAVTGRYFEWTGEVASSAASRDEDLAQWLWRTSGELIMTNADAPPTKQRQAVLPRGGFE